MSLLEDYQQYDAIGLAELIRRGDVSALELTDTAIATIEQINPKLNAVTHKFFQQAREQAQQALSAGPLAGVPFLIKDSLCSMQAKPMLFGSAYLAGLKRRFDADIIRRYRAAGLLLLGRTNTPEFGLSPVTEPQFTGVTANPWDLSVTAGGSSGGAAAAVASGMVPAAHGSDGGGSLRIPASCCGLFALKPSRGRVVMGPEVKRMLQGGIIDHVISRSVRDSALLLDVTLQRDSQAIFFVPPPPQPYADSIKQPPKRLRIAVSTQPFFHATVHDDCKRAVEQAAKLCQSLGHHVEWAEPSIDTDAAEAAIVNAFVAEATVLIKRIEKERGRPPRWNELEPPTRLVRRIGQALPASAFVEAMHCWDRLSASVSDFLTDFDVLLTPTLAQPPLPTGLLQPNLFEHLALNFLSLLPIKALTDIAIREVNKKVFNFIAFTPLFNMTGHPAMSVPLYWNQANLPIGVQFAARIGADDQLLALAAELESAQPWWHKRPTVAMN